MSQQIKEAEVISEPIGKRDGNKVTQATRATRASTSENASVEQISKFLQRSLHQV